jgi:hypothetical protein
MTEDVLSHAAWRRQQTILWVVCLLGVGGLAWLVETRDWPLWAKGVLIFGASSFLGMGAPATYRAYLREQQERADYADLLHPGRSRVLGKCRGCGRHTYAEEAFCVRCGLADPIPNATNTVQSVRFLIWIGRAVIGSTAITIAYLVVRALVRAAS